MYGFDKHKHLKSLTTLYAPVKIKKILSGRKEIVLKDKYLERKRYIRRKHDSNKLNE